MAGIVGGDMAAADITIITAVTAAAMDADNHFSELRYE
jgi:hypothetical protein